MIQEGHREKMSLARVNYAFVTMSVVVPGTGIAGCGGADAGNVKT